MDVASIPDLSLAECLRLVENHFDVQEIVGRSIGQASVLEYFRQSDHGYRLFHSQEGAMHVALNCDEQFTTAGYLGQVELFEQHLASFLVNNVLEIGCGAGYNTRHLADRLPKTRFVGIDISESHTETATVEAQNLTNVEYETGDFQQLPFDDCRFDAVLAVECLCQGSDMQRALREAFRVLRPGGKFLVIDVFRKAPLESFDDQIQLAARLVEKAMAVDEFAVFDEWIEETQKTGFAVEHQADLSEQISHNVARFYSLSRRFFKMPRAARALFKVFPPRLLENAVSGLLMPFTVGCGVQAYHFCALERPNEID